MTEQSNEPAVVTVDGASYTVTPTAFRSHYQVVGPDGTLVGLIEVIDVQGTRKCASRPASGTAMTLGLMDRIAKAATEAGVIK
jgi:hypothetical protein